ncbi:MAG: hypothetical protein WCD79_11445 [Chthoniobacteraceae bacterium]
MITRIRPYESDDFPQVEELDHAAFPEYAGDPPWRAGWHFESPESCAARYVSVDHSLAGSTATAPCGMSVPGITVPISWCIPLAGAPGSAAGFSAHFGNNWPGHSMPHIFRSESGKTRSRDWHSQGVETSSTSTR